MLCTAALVMTPAIGASADKFMAKRSGATALRGGIGTFTPASADPRLAAAFARSGIASSGFRFTPAASDSNRRSVRVAVRARAVGNNAGVNSVTPGATALLSVAPSLGVNPVVYNLGVGVGWKRLAEIASVAYELRADAFERLKVERPLLAQALFTFVIGIMAERLSFASRVIGVLQR